jgi:two-component system sensor histidine kinase KdpD
MLVVGAPRPTASQQRLLKAYAAYAKVIADRRRAATADLERLRLADADRTRTALLAAVSHDLRTPLATIRAAVDSLRSSDVVWSAEDEAELLAAVDEATTRLTALVDNLLDMSRLHAGAMSIDLQPTAVDEVISRALDDLGADGVRIVVDLPEDPVLVHADPGLLERVLANVAANALRYAPHETPPHLSSSRLGDRVEIRIIDRGPGIPPGDHERVFLPFQRLGDTDNTTGIGLGLALSRGLVEAMGGTLEPEETPGGGLTMVVSLPAADSAPASPGRRERSQAAS